MAQNPRRRSNSPAGDAVHQQTNFDHLSDTGRLVVSSCLHSTNLFAFAMRAFAEVYPGTRFTYGWHIEAMCYQLQLLANGDIRRLMINIPPRHLKSFCVSIVLPAFLLGLDPSMRMLVATYGQELGTEHGLGLRALMNSSWYRSLFPNTRLASENQNEIRTTAGGGVRNVSPRSSTTGFGADVIIIDDLMNATDASSEAKRATAREFFSQALRSRLNDQESGRIVSVQQRLHEEDPTAFLLELGDWTHLNLKAIADRNETHQLFFGKTTRRQAGEALCPSRQSLETLEQIRHDLGNPAFEAQYQQNPVPPDGALLRMDRLHFYNELPSECEEWPYVVQSWDTAHSPEPGADFSACTTWGFWRDHWYLIDVFRRRLAFPDVMSAIRAQKFAWHASTVLVEYAGSGQAIVQNFLRDTPGAREWLIGLPVRGDKVERVAGQTARLESGRFLFPGEETLWRDDLLRELRAFPNGRYDDQVDSIAHFVNWVSDRQLTTRGLERRRSTPVRKKGRRLNYGRSNPTGPLFRS